MRRLSPLLAALTLLLGAGAAEAKVHTIIRWAKTGGFAGVSETLRIRSDNVAFAGSRGGNPLPAQLGAKEVARLRSALNAAHLETLRRNYANPGAADTFQYSVTYRGHSVHADETRIPKRLRHALALLQKTYDEIFASSE
jgi:hypothetical protein